MRDHEVIIARLIDRPLRPLMPKAFRQDTQVLAWCLSFDSAAPPEPLAITAASAAVMLSGECLCLFMTHVHSQRLTACVLSKHLSCSASAEYCQALTVALNTNMSYAACRYPIWRPNGCSQSGLDWGPVHCQPFSS